MVFVQSYKNFPGGSVDSQTEKQSGKREPHAGVPGRLTKPETMGPASKLCGRFAYLLILPERIPSDTIDLSGVSGQVLSFVRREAARMSEAKRIYVADDDGNIRQIITTFLQSDGYEVEAFPTGDLLLERFLRQECDLVILDVMMPGSSGFDICTELRKISTVPIIMLTARDSETDYAMGLGLGSDDYITKPFSAMSLVMRIRAIFRRIEFESQKRPRTPEPEASLSVGSLTLDAPGRHILRDGSPLPLTPTEYELLKYLMLHAEQAVSREELLNQVWGFGTAVETRATDDTVRRLRQKLDGCGVVIEAVWGYGFRLKPGGGV